MKTLDFNAIDRPVLKLTMADDARTVIRVSTPTEGLVEELQATTPKLQEAFKAGGAESIGMCYNLAARLISCNLDFVDVTAEELIKTYRIDLQGLIVFYSAYMEFINEISNAKN